MQQFRNILVGVDLSHADRLAAKELNEPTLEAIHRAKWLAGANNAKLTFFTSLDLSAQTQKLMEEDAANTLQNSVNEVLDSLVKEAQAEGIDATCECVIGTGWIEIIRQVLRNNHDLVIVGTHRWGPTRRMLFGSTALKLLRKCPTPVWVTKPAPHKEVENILIASDLSEVSQDALQITISGSQLADSKVYLLHALASFSDGHIRHTGLPPTEVERLKKIEREEIQETLQDHLAQTDFRTLTYGVQIHIKDGPADLVICDAIREFDIDLLVMGTMARAGVSGMLLGNTAERLISQIDCSLLAVKPHDFVCPLKLDD